ncbi:MAG: hypothetical protein D3908_01715 [Candidatus Electrothrix sp. AUS4]|nr:hypothetical protein [Candidatus Electrothrix sp. AUS4]
MASDAQAWDNFGRSIAIDGEKVLIGSHLRRWRKRRPAPRCRSCLLLWSRKVFFISCFRCSFSVVTSLTAP